MSCFHTMEPVGQNKRQRERFVKFARRQHRVRIFCILLQTCLVVTPNADMCASAETWERSGWTLF